MGKSATFVKVDHVIQETKNLMNIISKVVSTCFDCANKVSVMSFLYFIAPMTFIYYFFLYIFIESIYFMFKMFTVELLFSTLKSQFIISVRSST